MNQKLFKKYMTYDGKRYEIAAIRNSKLIAEQIALNLREKGWLVRLESYGGLNFKWAVYKRKA
jgi:hypothetical protein